MSTKEKNINLSTSQINQSEAGPDIVDMNSSLFKNTQHSENIDSLKHNTSLHSPTRELYNEKVNSLTERDSTDGGKNYEINNEKLKQNTSPAIQVLDRLISLTPSPKQSATGASKGDRSEYLVSGKGKNSSSSLNMGALEQSVLEIELEKLHDLLLKQEEVNQKKISEYEAHMTKLTGQTCVLQDQLKQAEDREKVLVKKVSDQNQNHVQLSIVMQEYEKLISKLTAEIETEKKVSREKIENLTVEKDSALVHLANVEAAFTDVHQKYEKCKKVIEDYKKNEAKMKSLISDQMDSLKIKEKQLETIQVHASKQLENAHVEVERSKQSHEQEMTRLRALLRKTELKVMSLQESLEQKIKENQELTTICDDLIEGKVPSH